MNDNWALLNLDPTGDALAIKRAYAKQLKQNRPDDAPEAYQALRHAYEWAMREAEWIQHSDARIGQNFGSEEAEESWQSPPENASSILLECDGRDDGGGDEVIETDHASELLERWTQRLLDQDFNSLENNWSELRKELDQLPLSEQAASSEIFADFVLHNEAIVSAWLPLLGQYFQWGRDYREIEQLGVARLTQLRERLAQADPTVFRDAQLIERKLELLRLDWVVKEKGILQGQLYAFLSRSRIRQQLTETYDNEHRALDMSFVRWQGMSALASRALLFQLLLVLACVIPVAYLLIKPEQGLLNWVGWPLFFSGAYWFAAWGLGRSLPAAGDEMSRVLSELNWLHTDMSRHVAAIALSLVVALMVRDDVALTFLQSVFPDKALVGVAVLVCIAALLIQPGSRDERQIVFPMLGAFSFALTSLTNTEGLDWIVAMGAATAWIGLGGWVYSQYHEQVMRYFRNPWETLRPRAWWGWILLIVAFKFVIPLLILVLILALPITYRVIARYLSVETAWLAIALAVAFAMLIDPVKAASISFPLLVATAAVFTWLHAGTNWLSNKLFTRVPTSFFGESR